MKKSNCYAIILFGDPLDDRIKDGRQNIWECAVKQACMDIGPLQRNISVTVSARTKVSTDHLYETTYRGKNDHVTDDVTWPWKVKVEYFGHLGGHLGFGKSHAGGEWPPGLNFIDTLRTTEKCKEMIFKRPCKVFLRMWSPPTGLI